MTKGRSQVGHEHESWSNLTQWDLVLRQKTNFIQFPFSWISQVKSHSYSPVSGGSCVVWQSCCECETVAVSLWIRFYQIQSLLSRFLGENITTTAITHYLVTADWCIDKLQPITVFSHLFDKYIWPCASFTFWHNNEIKEEMLLVVC